MAVLTDSQAKDQAQKVSSLIEQLQHAEDAANGLSDHNLRSWVVDCIENALKALRGEY
jgi:hypothetical protein